MGKAIDAASDRLQTDAIRALLRELEETRSRLADAERERERLREALEQVRRLGEPHMADACGGEPGCFMCSLVGIATHALAQTDMKEGGPQ